MKKKDLRDYMVVETREGNRYLVVDNVKRLTRVEGFNNLYDYTEDLKCPGHPEYDIVAVFKPFVVGIECMLKHPGNPMWERKHTPEIGDIYNGYGNLFVITKTDGIKYIRLFKDGSTGKHEIEELDDYKFTGRNIKEELKYLLDEIEVK